MQTKRFLPTDKVGEDIDIIEGLRSIGFKLNITTNDIYMVMERALNSGFKEVA